MFIKVEDANYRISFCFEDILFHVFVVRICLELMDISGSIQTTGCGTTNASNLTVNISGKSAAAIHSDRDYGKVTDRVMHFVKPFLLDKHKHHFIFIQLFLNFNLVLI